MTDEEIRKTVITAISIARYAAINAESPFKTAEADETESASLTSFAAPIDADHSNALTNSGANETKIARITNTPIPERRIATLLLRALYASDTDAPIIGINELKLNLAALSGIRVRMFISRSLRVTRNSISNPENGKH